MPLLEYASCLWCCNNKCLISKIESVQRTATKYILNNYSNSIHDLNDFDINSFVKFNDILNLTCKNGINMTLCTLSLALKVKTT